MNLIDPMYEDAIEEMKRFDWETILDKANSLSAFNKASWRFMKAKIIELIVEKYSNGNLVYVDEKHKDFDWPSKNISVELKSITSSKIFTEKRKKLKQKYSILLNNSMGTNNKNMLDISEISDIILVIYIDGVFAITKDTALKHARKNGDGYRLFVPKQDIIPIALRKDFAASNENLSNVLSEIINLIKAKI